MRTRLLVTLLFITVTVHAEPTANNFVAVTNDWYNGRWTNVFELAQQRLAVNSNDLVAANIMVDYDVKFSSIQDMSNSIIRLMRVSDAATLPAYTNLYRVMRPGWVYYIDEFLPGQTEAELQQERNNPLKTYKALNCDFILKLLWENGAW
ncbi:MAG: hypothetical protein J5985_04335 [Kiritimatiellae bacterium]|nr:hypothetical protein [Kiritimatiellia bacterium]